MHKIKLVTMAHYLMRCASWTLNVDLVFHNLNFGFFLLKTPENTIYDLILTLFESYFSVLVV